MTDIPDPFGERRRHDGVLPIVDAGETIPMLLRHDDVRRAAKDWRTYSSDAPYRVPIPSEEALRPDRQLPIETDPPDHGDYRELVEPFFLRAREPAYGERVDVIIRQLIVEALNRERLEAVGEFALPLQSRALSVLLNMPEAEAERWIAWGVHVFHGPNGVSQAHVLDAYLHECFDRAETSPGDDFFSLLTQARFRDRPLSRSEMVGFANLAFAGGRDTIIHTVACILGHFAEHPHDLDLLREDRGRIVLASEEFFRVFMPLTHIGRVCPVGGDVHGVPVAPGGRVSLGWASANLDETAFSCPRDIRLDRRPNPHVAFGFGPHLCLGAAHSRTVVRGLLEALCDQVKRIDLIEARPRVERTVSYERPLGYESLIVVVTGTSS